MNLRKNILESINDSDSERDIIEFLNNEFGGSFETTDYAWADVNMSVLENNEGVEIHVFPSEELAREAAIQRVREDLEGNPEFFDQDFLTDYINDDFFEEVAKESNEFYAEDIANESSDTAINRLAEEMVERGVISQEDANDPNTDYYQEYGEDFVESMLSDIRNSNYTFFEEFKAQMGDENVKAILDKNPHAIDIDAAAEAAVDIDGTAHFLSGYDGQKIELPNGYVGYR